MLYCEGDIIRGGKYDNYPVDHVVRHDRYYAWWLITKADLSDELRSLLHCYTIVKPIDPPDTLWFGKYRGCTLQDVQQRDPSYVDFLKSTLKKPNDRLRVLFDTLTSSI